MHRPELVHADEFSVLAYPLEADKHPVGGTVIADRFLYLRGDNVEFSVYDFLVQHVEAGTVQSPQDLDTGKGTCLTFRYPVVKLFRKRELRNDPMPTVVHKKEDTVDNDRILPHDFLPAYARSGAMAGYEPSILQAVVAVRKECVDMSYLVQRTPVDDEPGQPHFMGKHRFRIARIDNHRIGRERPAVLLHPPKYFRSTAGLHRHSSANPPAPFRY